MKERAYISFDYDYDLDLKTLLVGQSRHPDTPFEIIDYSIKEASPNWRDNARRRIRGCTVIIVICGQYTNAASGVSAEVEIAQQEYISYFLLWGRAAKTCVKPIAAYSTDKMYRWTWENLKALIHGAR